MLEFIFFAALWVGLSLAIAAVISTGLSTGVAGAVSPRPAEIKPDIAKKPPPRQYF